MAYKYYDPRDLALAICGAEMFLSNRMSDGLEILKLPPFSLQELGILNMKFADVEALALNHPDRDGAEQYLSGLLDRCHTALLVAFKLDTKRHRQWIEALAAVEHSESFVAVVAAKIQVPWWTKVLHLYL